MIGLMILILGKITFGILPLTIIAFFVNQWFEPDTNSIESMRPKIKLMVGITSSQDHFEQRNSLRETWLQLHQDKFHYKFLVGNETCNISPPDRVFDSGCESLNISISKGVSEKTQFLVSAGKFGVIEEETENAIGFNFYTNHKIEVNFLGILKAVKTNNANKIARVFLKDLKSNLKVKSSSFHDDSFHFYLEKDGYILKKLDKPVVLPRGFEGSVVIDGARVDHKTCSKSTKWMHNNLITIYSIITDNKTSLPNDACVYTTFGFVIKDLDNLKTFIENKPNRTTQWLDYAKDLNGKLQLESNKYGDVLMLNMVDVYRNLPQKMLLFFDWLFQTYNTDFVLKTDDDTFIDIPTVLSELRPDCNWDIWSCFREGWPPHKQGRHREVLFDGAVYPTFPCGAGYVLSKNALAWLQSRMGDHETKYAGEDVAMGIWVEGMVPQRHFGEACHWACNDHCHQNTCNIMQLTIDKMYQVSSDYQRCGNSFCLCPARDASA